MLEKVRSRPKTISPDDGDNAGRHSLGRRLLDLVFGYDFFISYSWSDGGSYAAALTRQLRSNGFEVFLDRDNYASGDDWKKVGAWKLRRTGQLVLVGSPAALHSAPVIREVEIFSATGRRIVPIDFDGTLEWTQKDAPLAPYLPAEILRIREPAGALQAGPSDQAVATIRRTFNLVRQDKKRVNAMAITAVVLGLLTVAAGVASVVAVIARNTAVEQRDRAQRVLDQVTASANARVMAYAERAQAAASKQKEIADLGAAGALPDLDRASELIRLSGRYFDERDYAAALKAAETAMPLLGAANAASQAGPDTRLMTANGFERIGLAKAQLRLKDAQKDLATSLELIQSLATASPENAELHERMAAAQVNMGDIGVATKDFEDAERHYKEAIRLRAEAADLATSTEAGRLLAAAYRRMAGLQLTRAQYAAAVDTSGVSIAMLEALRTKDGNDRVLRDLSAAYDIQAKAVSAAGNASQALALREKEFAITRQLADRDPDNIEWQHDLTLGFDTRGQVLEALKQDDAADTAYKQAIAVGEALKARPRVPPEWLRDTAAALGHRGALLRRRGDTSEAVDVFRSELAILERLSSSYPGVVSPTDREEAYRQARETLLKANLWADALETAEQQLFAISLAADRETPDVNRLAQVLSSVCWTAILARDTSRATEAGQQALALAPGLAAAKPIMRTR